MKKTIMIDMDDVMTSSDNFISIISDFLGRKVTADMAKDYYLQELLEDKKEEFFKGFKDINLYKNETLEPNCYEVLELLNEKYELYICTSYIWRESVETGGINVRNKYEFLYKALPFINPTQYIFTTNKTIIDFDIRIDDSMKHLAKGETKLLYTAYHNKNITDEELNNKGIIRVNNWSDIKKILID